MDVRHDWIWERHDWPAFRWDASRLAPLRGKLNPAAPAFDIRAFREQAHDPALRD